MSRRFLSSILLASAALAFRRPRVIVFLNYWFTGLIAWNLCTILIALLALTR